MNKNYKIAYNIAWTLIPVFLLFGNNKELRDNPLVWLGVFVWVIINVILIVRQLKKSEVEELVTHQKVEEIMDEFSNAVESIDDDIADIINPLNNGEPVVEHAIEKGWINIHDAFRYRRDNMIFRAASRGKNGILFTWAFGNLKPTDITILIQAFPLTNPEDYDKIVSHFLISCSKNKQTGSSLVRSWEGAYDEWMRYSYKNPEKKKHCLDILVMNKNNFLHMIVLESMAGDQMRQLKNFLSLNYKN